MRKYKNSMICIIYITIIIIVSQLTTYSVDYSSTIQYQDTTDYNLNTVANETTDVLAWPTEYSVQANIEKCEIPNIQTPIGKHSIITIWTNKETFVYSEMNMNSIPIASLYQGYKLQIEKIDDTWCRILSTNFYITTDNISYKEVTKNLNITKWVICNSKLKSEPSIESNVISTLKAGSVVTVIDNSNNWSKVMINDNLGFVETRYLSETKYVPSSENSLGHFKITHYCNCPKCCGQWAGLGTTATGEKLQENFTIAVDPNVIPYGTKVIINDNVYIAQDCGGGVNGNHIDIYVGSHEEAINNGTYTVEVFKVND